MLKIDIEPIKGILCIRLSGNLSKGNVYKLKKEVTDLLKNIIVKNMVLNIKNLNYIDSYGKKVIIESFEICRFNKGNCFICLNDEQEKRLKLGKFKFLNIIKDELKAVDSINL